MLGAEPVVEFVSAFTAAQFVRAGAKRLFVILFVADRLDPF